MKKSLQANSCTFQSKHIAKDWLDLFKQHPYGDYYRLSTINPLVLQMALWAKRRQVEPNLPPPPVDLGTAIFAQMGTPSDDPCALLETFHQNVLKICPSEGQPLQGLRVVDFGCGNGYLAPILSALGAEYCGLDNQPDFISFAKGQGNLGDKVGFHVADLDRICLSKDLPHLGTIDLALSIMVLEHLKNPHSLLTQLRALSSESAYPTALLLVTENPRYYGQTFRTIGTDERYLKTTSKVPIVCLGGASVDVTCHDHDDVSVMLRDAGYTVLEEGYHRLPSKWEDFPRKHYNCRDLVEVNWGVAPFRSILAVPLPTPRSIGYVTFEALEKNTILRTLKDSSHESLLVAIRKEGVFIRLRPNQPLLTRHDLGGCLFLVTYGLLCSEHQPESVFEQFSCFGELEANRGPIGNAYYGFFVHDVHAGPDGAEVFVIPEGIASQLLARDRNLVSNLFSELRKKVLLRNDRITLRKFDDGSYPKGDPQPFDLDLKREKDEIRVAEDGEGLPASLIKGLALESTVIPFNNIVKYDLGRFAGALLNLSEMETQAGCRVPEARVVFCDIRNLQRIAEIRDPTEDTGSRFLRLLSVLGVLDAIPVTYLKHFPDVNGKYLNERLAEELISYVKSQTYQALSNCSAFGNLDRKVAMICEARVADLAKHAFDAVCFRKLDGKFSSRVTKHFGRLRTFVTDCSSSLFDVEVGARGDILNPILKAANRFLGLNVLIKDEKPRFIVIHDASFLRTLAYAPVKEVDRALIVRALAQQRDTMLSYNNFEVVAHALARADDAHGRIRYYTAAFAQFLRDDWERDGNLRYSGGGNSGVDLPQKIVP